MQLLLVNIGELATLSEGDPNKPLTGDSMHNREQLVHNHGTGIYIEEDKIIRIDDSQKLFEEYSGTNVKILDVESKAIVPGFVDSHTHLVWAGDRANEMNLRRKGYSYQDIANAGGGIQKTVDYTRSTSEEHLINKGLDICKTALKFGTTTIEGKSGYGLTTKSEINLLQAIKKIGSTSPQLILGTWLGAHDFPKNTKKSDYIESLISDQLPLVVENNLANWVDVFCEPGWYDLEQTETIIKASHELGLRSRIHVDEFVDGNGLSLAAELGCDSGDHVGFSNSESREAANKAGTLQTFLPGTPYVLGNELIYPLNECLDNNWAFGFATDYNPNCNTISLPFVGSLATHRLNLDPLAALVAVTRNPASSLNLKEEEIRGSIREGGIADLNILKSNYIDGWCQTPGISPVSKTIISGELFNH
ncbi:MAG: imidazolonepropionase [Euryarchaeota archaeon]|jgi:imidazolonepropionase|nr:imidazolonepropionase [Euryarchaeota archaeon]MBT3757509.1 imidazolonepropionase [Euryarchaeota archaeon]MBT4050602.1 imidazolonepropionase [Euryarchaeota archaeon]MBT4650734.1 imidazolonepropionase [Euryarchaeota archaeon]MBT5280285.1 imidazolonepropionase [Euryarchaeota archaeon]